MHCAGCEIIIENSIKQLQGIEFVKADYENDQLNIVYDEQLTSLEAIADSIKNAGYEPRIVIPSPKIDQPVLPKIADQRPKKFAHALKKIAFISLAVTGVILVLWLDIWLMEHADMPELSRDISFGLLFLIGFLTSFHCLGMCGPLILGYTAKSAKAGHHSHVPHVLYGLGKTISYTVIGGLFGAFGSIVTFTPYSQGIVGIAAGLFLILFGLHMLEAFAVLRHFQIRTPGFWKRLIGYEYRKHSNPFIIGLLNGLMIICGPLQAMYVMAAGTGNWLEGASVLFFFGLGTLPLLMGFGVLTSLFSLSLTPKLLNASGYVVMVLGVVMLNRGLTVTGTGMDFNTLITKAAQNIQSETQELPATNTSLQVITMDVLRSGYSPNKFVLRKGVPVKWVINGKELTECNKAIVVPQFNLKINIQSGIQAIEFTPQEAGVIPWSCWMGMIPGSFVIVDESTNNSNSESGPEKQNWQNKLMQKLRMLIR